MVFSEFACQGKSPFAGQTEAQADKGGEGSPKEEQIWIRRRFCSTTPRGSGQRGSKSCAPSALCGSGGKRAGAAPTLRPLPEPVVVYCKVGGGGLDQLLAGLARLGMPRTVLKAVLTPTNAGWTFAALYGELVRERRAML